MANHSFNSDLVRPLTRAENQFLQVLVNRFRIRRNGKGFELQVAFGEKSPVIWLREAKRRILNKLRIEQRKAMQQKLDDFFRSDKETFDYRESNFPFRLGNGGTLPIIRLNGTDYYCLFYRDTHPTGWNIANGAANTRHDLLHPDLIVERELREEMIIVEPKRRRWYVFDWHDARLRDHSDFAVAHALWAEHFRRQGFSEMQDVPVPLKWFIPPDAELPGVEHDAMRIQCGDDAPIYTGLGFLNINAEDFGIEFDRIAKLSVGPEAVFCDGELRRDGKLLNRVVGLFAVKRLQQLIGDGENRFFPDRMFWDGVERTGDDPKKVVGQFLKRRNCSWAQQKENMRKSAAPDPPRDPFDLCPVTRTIVGRHRQLRDAELARMPSLPAGAVFDVFVSFASEDRELARAVYEQIGTSGRHPFFSDVTLTCGGFADQIDEALDSAQAFVAVASRAKHLEKSWVKYEWRQFQNDVLSGKKPKAPFFAFVTAVNPQDLPRPLRLNQAITADPANLKPAFDKLAEFIAKP